MASKTARLGAALRSLRQRNGWSLADVAKRTGISVSTLSKVENDRMSLTYDKLASLSEGLGVDITYFFGEHGSAPEAVAFTGRRSVDRGLDEGALETSNYIYRYLNTELSRKKMVPLVVEHRTRTLEEFGPYVRHAGEEFLFVLEGHLAVHTEFYAPVVLEPGDSIYIDSTMGHAYLNAGEGSCRTLAVCTAPEAQIDAAVTRLEAPEAEPQVRSPVLRKRKSLSTR